MPSVAPKRKGAKREKKGYDPSLIHKKSDKASFNINQIVKRETGPEEKYEITETRRQREIVLTNLEGVLEDLGPARRWEYRKWIVFFITFMSVLMGAGLSLWAWGETVLFKHENPDMIRFGVACIFFLPFFWWLKTIFFPHGEYREGIEDVREKRSVRKHEEKQRKLHLQGRLPRPEEEIENESAPYEYIPDEPWMYVREKPKPKQRFFIDDDNIAHKVMPGSDREKQAIAEEEEMQAILSGEMKGVAVGDGLRASNAGQDDRGTAMDETVEDWADEVDDVELGNRKSSMN